MKSVDAAVPPALPLVSVGPTHDEDGGMEFTCTGVVYARAWARPRASTIERTRPRWSWEMLVVWPLRSVSALQLAGRLVPVETRRGRRDP